MQIQLKQALLKHFRHQNFALTFTLGGVGT